MDREEVRAYVNQYCRLRDVQFAAYVMLARKHRLTALFSGSMERKFREVREAQP